MKTGTMKADAVIVGELAASFLGTTIKFTAKAAFANVATRETHGWTENSNWSPATMQKLRELKEAMEEDLAKAHFVTADAEKKDGLTLHGNAPKGSEEDDLSSFLGVGPDAPPA